MPVQPSPAVGRAAQVLKLLATDPSAEWTLAELARALDVHRASLHTVTLALCAEGLVARRGPRGGFALGPRLVGLGVAARRSLGVVDLAEPELLALRDRFGTTALLGMTSGESILPVVVFPAAHPLGYGMSPGLSIPYRAPIGSVYVAWDADEEIDAWIGRGDPPLVPAQRKQVRRDLALIRSRGWSATVLPDGGTRGATSYREAHDADLEAGHGVVVVGISAPVWNAAAEVECSVALSSYHERIPGKRLLQMASAARASADRLTGLLGGLAPG